MRLKLYNGSRLNHENVKPLKTMCLDMGAKIASIDNEKLILIQYDDSEFNLSIELKDAGDPFVNRFSINFDYTGNQYDLLASQNGAGLVLKFIMKYVKIPAWTIQEYEHDEYGNPDRWYLYKNVDYTGRDVLSLFKDELYLYYNQFRNLNYKEYLSGKSRYKSYMDAINADISDTNQPYRFGNFNIKTRYGVTDDNIVAHIPKRNGEVDVITMSINRDLSLVEMSNTFRFSSSLNEMGLEELDDCDNICPHCLQIMQ